jgi:UDP-glucose 4-epimerase
MRTIVTGGAGFIGSHVADALVARGDDVHVMDSLVTGSRDNLPAEATFHEADIRTDADAVFAAARPEVCFHLAAQADVMTSVAQPGHDADVNVLGTIAILEAARAHGTRVVFTSTGGAIYGECDGPAREDAPRRPLSPYGIAKLAAEEYLAGWNRLYGSGHVALRLGNVYGPRQLAALEGGVIAIFLERMHAAEPTAIFGDGEQTRDFVYVGDVVRALLAAGSGGDGVYNVGTGRETSVNELHAACRTAAGSAAEPEYKDPRPGEVRRSVIDPSRLRADLGVGADTALADGLALTYATLG